MIFPGLHLYHCRANSPSCAGESVEFETARVESESELENIRGSHLNRAIRGAWNTLGPRLLQQTTLGVAVRNYFR